MCKMKSIYVLACVLLLFMLVEADNYTFTYDMALRCKEHLCNGYNYETFYRVDSISKHTREPNILFEMHIAILAASNGHILLSSAPKVDANDPVYEIVVGGGANKFTELRRNVRKNARASSKTLGILSTIDFRAFYIKISEDGEIKFGKEGEELPVISYMDYDPIPINYFSFAAWNGVEAKFLYDCPAPGQNTSQVPDSEEVKRNISNYDNLIRTLFRYRDPSIPPAQEVKVDIGLHVTSFSFDELDSIFSIGLSIILKWTDDSLAWNPNKFNGTTYLSLRPGQIWSPILYVFDDISGMGPAISEHVTVVHSGEATLHMQLFIKSWCSGSNDTVTKWPQDVYSCAIILEPWEVHDKIHLNLLDDNSKEMKTFSDIQEVVVNAWEMSVKPIVADAKDWNEIFAVEESFTTVHSDKLIVDLFLTRRSATYNIILYTPLLVLVTFLLLSFWTEPLQVERIRLYTFSAIVICMGLCYIDYIVPCNTIPSILVLYVTVLGGVMLALLIQVAMMTSLAEKVCKNAFIQDILMLRFLRNLFCLQESKAHAIYVSINEGYSAQEDDESVPNNVDIEEMQQDTKDNPEKVEVAEVVDKLLFVVYSITFAVMLILH